VVVSEPLDHDRSGWQTVPPGHMIVVRDGRTVIPEPIPHDRRLAAE
jgi:predicted glutamine amidotransferase